MSSATSPPTSTTRLAQATSILLLTATAGLNSSLSFFLIPRLLESPTPLLIRHFASTTCLASRIFPPLFAIPAFLNIYLAYVLPSKSRSHCLAAVLSLSITAWSWAVMRPIDKKMQDKMYETQTLEALVDAGGNAILTDEVAAEAAGEETAHALIDKWGLKNLYRPAAALVAGCLEMYAALT